MMKVTIPFRLPSLNEYVNESRKNKYGSAKFKKKLENDIIVFLRKYLKQIKIEDKIRIKFVWYENDKRRDKDNICSAKKFILDAMQKAGYLCNDGWKQIEGFIDEFYIDKDNARVEVFIEKVS